MWEKALVYMEASGSREFLERKMHENTYYTYHIIYIYHVKKCGKRLLIEASVPKVQVALFIVKRVLLSMCLHIPEGYV